MRLALGTVQFGLAYGIANRSGQIGRDEASKILAIARSAGVSTLDTAIAYGESEACLGSLGVGDFAVVTKLPAVPEDIDDVPGWVMEQIRGSLARLRLSSVYGVLLHRPQQLTGARGKPLLRALEKLKGDGIVERIGVSIYSPAELESVTQLFALDLVQAPFNLMDRRLHTSGWLERLSNAGVAVHARSVFLQGLLLMPASDIPDEFAAWGRLWDTWHDWLASRRDTSAAAACIGFVQSFPEVNKVVVGVDTAAQLEDLVAAARTASATDWPEIDTADERLINPSNWHSL